MADSGAAEPKVDKRSSKKNVNKSHVSKSSTSKGSDKHSSRHSSKKHLSTKSEPSSEIKEDSKPESIPEEPSEPQKEEKTSREEPVTTPAQPINDTSETADKSSQPEKPLTSRDEIIAKIQELQLREAELKRDNADLLVKVQLKKQERLKLVNQSEGSVQKQGAKKGELVLPKVSELNRATKFRPAILDKENKTHREMIICEFLTTEQSYVTALEILKRIYYDGVSAFIKANPKQIDENLLDTVFGNLTNLLVMNGKLCEALETRLTEWEQPGKDRMSDIFLTLGVQLKGSYCIFGGYYENGQKTYHAQSNSNPAWKKIFEQLDEHIGSGLKFESYYIQPVQRVPRYCLLLRDLLKATPESHHDYQALTKAGEEMDNVASQINSKIKEADLVVHFNNIITRTTGGFKRLKDEPSLEPGTKRIWQKDGDVARIIDIADPKKGQNKKTQELLLFGDCIVASPFLTKKCLIQEATQPTKVLWMTTALTDKDKELITDPDEFKFSAKVSGPEGTWLIAFKTNADKIKWQNDIIAQMGVMVTGLADAGLGKRKGRYVFKNGATYNGEWLNGKIHGVGKYTSGDGEYFNGRWDSVSKSGFGETHQGLSGWKEQPDGTVQAVDPHFFWKCDQLLDRDWQLMLCKGKTTTFPKGELIITQGKKNTRMIKLVKGELAIEKITDPEKPPLLLKVLQVSADKPVILGETAVIPTIQQATANVRAHTDIEIIEVDIKLLFNIFASEPGVAMRFYRWVAQSIAEKIRQSHPKSAPPQKKDDDSDESSSEEERPRPGQQKVDSTKKKDKEKKKDNKDKAKPKKEVTVNYQQKFGLAANEILLKQTPAKLQGWKDKAGMFYVFSNTLVFEYAPVFGSALHENINLDSITFLTGDEKNEELKIDTKNKKYRLVLQKDFQNIFIFTEKLYQDSLKSHDEHGSAGASTGKPIYAASDARAHPAMTRTNSRGNLGKRKIKTENVQEASPTDSGINMGPDDWNRLIEGATLAAYRKGDKIVEEGKKHQRIYHIATGTCDIIKDTPDGPRHLVTLPQDSVFGELTFLDPRNQQATASVIAGSDDCTVNIIEGSWINLLMVDHPQIAGRFYNYLCSILAKRLSEREMEMQAEQKKAAKAEEEKKEETKA